MHIEVLQDKVEDMEKERETITKDHAREIKELEIRVKADMDALLTEKDFRID